MMRATASVVLALCLAVAAPALAGTISGTVTRTVDGSAVVGAQVAVFTTSGAFVTFASSGAAGAYTVDAGTGTFVVAVFAQRLVTEVYDDVACPLFECDFGLATPIPVASGGAVTGIDFALDAQPRITGTVTGGSPVAPQASVTLTATTASGDVAGVATSGGDGSYELFFDPGSVRVSTANVVQLVDELHPDLPCPFGNCATTGATVFTLATGQVQGGVDFVLAPGAAIGGEVTVAGSGAPVAFQSVDVFADDGSFLAATQSGDDGSWRIATGMLPGSYRAAVRTATGSAFASQVWDGNACNGPPGSECDIVGGDAIVLAALQLRTDIDFALTRGTGVLSGTVARFGSGTPLVGVSVSLFSGTQFVASTPSGFDGTWQIEVAPGTYTVRAQPDAPLAEELYPDVQCLGAFFICAGAAQQIAIAAGQDIAGIDFALAPVATLSVTARNSATAAELPAEWRARVPGFEQDLQRFSTPGEPAVFPVLNGGDVRFAGRSASCGPLGDEVCLGEQWPDDPCPALVCDLATGTPIAVAKGAEIAGIELVLGAGATITGTVIEQSGGAPVAGTGIEVVDANRVAITNATTDIDGSYSLAGLGGGPYFVYASPPEPLIGELYDDIACPNAACAPGNGTPIATVPGVTTTGIDFALAAGGTIAGRVTSDLGVPVAGAAIAVFDDGAVQVGSSTSDADGDYETSGLEPGGYFVRFSKPGFTAVLYAALPCPDAACDPLGGTPVPVLAGQTTAGIDAVLTDTGEPPPPQLVFLNRCTGGCQVRQGFESSINNTSSIVSGTRVLAGYPFGDASFAALEQCTRETFARYRITITTTDPGNVPHREHMVGGTPQQLGFSSGVAGVSPYTCGSIPNSISFTFAEAIGDDLLELCWTVAHEIAHGFGLDHEFHPPDAMSYLLAPTKTFTFDTVPCGELGPRPCACGASTQNSNALLTEIVGVEAQLFADGFEAAAATNAATWKQYRSPHPKLRHPVPLACGTDTIESANRQ